MKPLQRFGGARLIYPQKKKNPYLLRARSSKKQSLFPSACSPKPVPSAGFALLSLKSHTQIHANKHTIPHNLLRSCGARLLRVDSLPYIILRKAALSRRACHAPMARRRCEIGFTCSIDSFTAQFFVNVCLAVKSPYFDFSSPVGPGWLLSHPTTNPIKVVSAQWPALVSGTLRHCSLSGLVTVHALCNAPEPIYPSCR